ncbi:MAG: hypothetical protein E7164_02205 [Firmicutes bacterium]|nr:hypothetical protein [Bacillota bacterium]
MAITKASQVLDIEKVYAALEFLDEAANYLKIAYDKTKIAKAYSSNDVFDLNNGGNKIPQKANDLLVTLDNLIIQVQDLKLQVLARAKKIYQSEYNEYQNYLKTKGD